MRPTCLAVTSTRASHCIPLTARRAAAMSTIQHHRGRQSCPCPRRRCCTDGVHGPSPMPSPARVQTRERESIVRCRVHEWHPGCGAEMHGRSCPPELGMNIQYAIMALPHQSTHHSTRATASAATTVRIKLPPVPCCWFVCILVVLLSSLSRSHYNHCMRYCLRTTYYSCWYLTTKVPTCT